MQLFITKLAFMSTFLINLAKKHWNRNGKYLGVYSQSKVNQL